MCGIVGLINCGTFNKLEKMVASVNHRGPDDNGLLWFDNFNSGIGHTRLSIIDLSKRGHQPMSNEKKTLHITFIITST